VETWSLCSSNARLFLKFLIDSHFHTHLACRVNYITKGGGTLVISSVVLQQLWVEAKNAAPFFAASAYIRRHRPRCDMMVCFRRHEIF
jgi:predicted YcjX-like family ATPase